MACQSKLVFFESGGSKNSSGLLLEPARKRRKSEYKLEWEKNREWLYFDDYKDGTHTNTRNGVPYWLTISRSFIPPPCKSSQIHTVWCSLYYQLILKRFSILYR